MAEPLKCGMCGAALEGFLFEGTLVCDECRAENKIVKGIVVEVNGEPVKAKRLGKPQASGKTPSDSRNQEEQPVKEWVDNYKGYYKIKNVPDALAAFCNHYGYTQESVITRERFRYQWEQFAPGFQKDTVNEKDD